MSEKEVVQRKMKVERSKANNDSDKSRKKHRISKAAIVLIVVLILLSAALVVILFQEGHVTPYKSKTDYFTIIEEDPCAHCPLAGMNGSYYKGTNVTWPVLNVHSGDTVVVHILNNASSEPHGFAIQHYFDSQIFSLASGQSYTLKFVANEIGTFKIYCDIFCTIHQTMQNGELIVS